MLSKGCTYRSIMTKPPIDPYPVKPGQRPNLFLIAYRNFPGSLFATIIGIALWGSPFLYGYFHGNGANSVLVSLLLMGIVMTTVPLVIVYLVSLVRARKFRTE